LIALAAYGIHSVELGNAILFSSLTGKIVEMPLSGAAHARALKKLIASSKQKPKVVKRKSPPSDFSKSF